MNSLFDALPMPGSAAPVSAAAALPSLAPASPADDDSWAQSLAAAEPPEQDADGSWGAGGGEPDPEDDDAAPTAEDLAAVAPTWEGRQADVAALVARAQADAARARAAATGEGVWPHAAGATPSGTVGWGGAPGRAQPGSGGTRPGPDADALLAGLNPAQAEAVTHAGSPLLIIAGAGSGKTRVLTHRIAYLLATRRARAGEILAITFTNKAAAEMRERVAALVGEQARFMWVSTFHSACVRILRREHEAAGLRSTFTIYDAADSQRLITLIVRELGIDPKRFTPKSFAHRISDLKNELVTPDAFEGTAQVSNPFERHLAAVYRAYAARLVAANALDFDDLIMRTVTLLQERPAIAEMYRRRFRHIMVDEYQDTNHAQYALVRELVGARPTEPDAGSRAVPTALSALQPGELTVVGDSDQSIYAFRGATIRNIEEFEQDYPDARTILLEQNYRSTQNILDAANAVISRNTGRRKKNLFTESGAGAPITGYVADSEHDEARWISRQVDRLADEEGVRPGDVAVFYRTNAQSRALEEAFVRSGQPYKVVGGTRFYERREVKDAIAYLHAVDNPDDDVSVRRVLNVPRRGLGDKAEAALADHAARLGVSFGQAVADAAGQLRPARPSTGPADDAAADADGSAASASSGADSPGSAAPEDGDGTNRTPPSGIEPPEVLGLTPRARTAVTRFHELLTSLRHMLDDGDGVADLLDSALDASGYLAELRASDDPQDATRVENLAELHSVAADFQAANPEGTLADFLERVSLVADSDQLPAASDLRAQDAGASGGEGAVGASGQGEDQGQITLMTVHTAKGLEFPVVFVTGMEDGTFPHVRALGEESELAEERRLAYVALTRARERLYVSRAAVRSAWGAANAMPASRFLDDVPAETIDWERLTSSTEALRAGSTGWGAGWGEGGFGRGSRARTGGEGRRREASSEDDDFAPAIGSGRSGRLGKVETAKDRAAKRAAGRSAGRSKPVRLGAPAPSSDEDCLPEGLGGLRVGDQVRHESYGVGTVVGLEGSGRSTTARVEFSDAGAVVTKRLMLRYAPVTRLL